MQRVEDPLVETIHVYVIREDEEQNRPPSVLPAIASFLLLMSVITVGMLYPYHQVYEEKTISVPAAFLPLMTFRAAASISPTGMKTYPAVQARGVLTVYNGSILTQRIPQGMILSARNGIEIVVDASVTVPAGNPPSYGIATVPAHAVASGSQGNIATFAVDAVYGTSLYIRNLQAFHGGKDAYSVKVVTPGDRQTATDTARASLTTQQAHIKAFLAFPCKETASEKNNVVGLSMVCQYVTYNVPPYMKVTHIRLVEKTLLVDVVFVEHPLRIWVK